MTKLSLEISDAAISELEELSEEDGPYDSKKEAIENLVQQQNITNKQQSTNNIAQVNQLFSQLLSLRLLGLKLYLISISSIILLLLAVLINLISPSIWTLLLIFVVGVYTIGILWQTWNYKNIEWKLQEVGILNSLREFNWTSDVTNEGEFYSKFSKQNMANVDLLVNTVCRENTTQSVQLQSDDLNMDREVIYIDREEIWENLQQIESDSFKSLVADIWIQHFGSRVEMMSTDSDIDMIAESEEGTLQIIQARRYDPNTTMDVSEVHEYASLQREVTDVEQITVVTLGNFSEQIEEIAGEMNVALVDGGKLLDIIEDIDSDELIKKYFIDSDSVTDQPMEEVESSDENDRNIGDVGNVDGKSVIDPVGWECENCSRIHPKNSPPCKQCGHMSLAKVTNPDRLHNEGS